MIGGCGREGSQNMVKTLARQGNSTCLILDRSLMDLLDLDSDSAVRITVEGRKMIVEPLSEEERAAMFKKILAKTGKKNAKLFQKLAK
jgi:antitoxin component of MazEF toxin-antitoxin module